jgi:hypothetical protein
MALTVPLLEQQIRDCIAILNCLHEDGPTTALSIDPIVKMWKGYELQLAEFGLDCCDELFTRSSEKKGMWTDERARLEQHLDWATSGNMEKPPWLDDPNILLDYKGILVGIDPMRYKAMFGNIAPCEPENFRYPV